MRCTWRAPCSPYQASWRHVHPLHTGHRRPTRLRAAQEFSQTQLDSTTTGHTTEQDEKDSISCIATGIDVTCYLPDGPELKASAADGHASTPTVEPGGQQATLVQQLAGMALLASPFAFWGTSMVAMKSLMVAVPPLLMGSFRLLPAGGLLVAWAASQGRPQPVTAAAWAWITAFALIDGAAFQGFLAIGLERTPAGLGSVIIDSQPLTVAVLASLLFNEHLGTLGVASLLLGVAGLLLLELPEQYLLLAAGGLLDDALPASQSIGLQEGQLLADASTALATSTSVVPGVPAVAGHVGGMLTTASDLATSIWASLDAEQVLQMISPSSWLASGEFWMLAAAQSMAVGTVMVRYVTKHVDPVMATGWHMVLGGLVLGVAALLQDSQVLGTTLSHLGPEDIASAVYVSVLGGAASYGIFFWQASQPGNLTKLSSLTFLTPVFAAVTGFFVLGEVLTPPQLLGGAITLVSVLLINSNNAKQKA